MCAAPADAGDGRLIAVEGVVATAAARTSHSLMLHVPCSAMTPVLVHGDNRADLRWRHRAYCWHIGYQKIDIMSLISPCGEETFLDVGLGQTVQTEMATRSNSGATVHR
jgi:hypothetical protein